MAMGHEINYNWITIGRCTCILPNSSLQVHVSPYNLFLMQGHNRLVQFLLLNFLSDSPFWSFGSKLKIASYMGEKIVSRMPRIGVAPATRPPSGRTVGQQPGKRIVGVSRRNVLGYLDWGRNPDGFCSDIRWEHILTHFSVFK